MLPRQIIISVMMPVLLIIFISMILMSILMLINMTITMRTVTIALKEWLPRSARDGKMAVLMGRSCGKGIVSLSGAVDSGNLKVHQMGWSAEFCRIFFLSQFDCALPDPALHRLELYADMFKDSLARGRTLDVHNSLLALHPSFRLFTPTSKLSQSNPCSLAP